MDVEERKRALLEILDNRSGDLWATTSEARAILYLANVQQSGTTHRRSRSIDRATIRESKVQCPVALGYCFNTANAIDGHSPSTAAGSRFTHKSL